ncbi:MAG: hypothetical protein JXA33_28060 [Anaerolineae bacterium]|nr:hypothetical protein [Anaerolineae bacterium]
MTNDCNILTGDNVHQNSERLRHLSISRGYHILTLIAWLLALIGYFGPWVGQRAAALAWNAYDLFDLLRLLPEIETGAVIVNLQSLRLPLIGLAVFLPLWAASNGCEAPRTKKHPGKWRPGIPFKNAMLVLNGALLLNGAVALLGMGLALMTLPGYPQILGAWRAPGWRVPFWWGLGAMAGAAVSVWLGPRLGRYHPWVSLAWLALTGIPAALTFSRLLPALSTLHALPIHPGWGFWVCMTGMGLLALLAWWQGTFPTIE